MTTEEVRRGGGVPTAEHQRLQVVHATDDIGQQRGVVVGVGVVERQDQLSDELLPQVCQHILAHPGGHGRHGCRQA